MNLHGLGGHSFSYSFRLIVRLIPEGYQVPRCRRRCSWFFINPCQIIARNSNIELSIYAQTH